MTNAISNVSINFTKVDVYNANIAHNVNNIRIVVITMDIPFLDIQNLDIAM